MPRVDFVPLTTRSPPSVGAPASRGEGRFVGRAAGGRRAGRAGQLEGRGGGQEPQVGALLSGRTRAPDRQSRHEPGMAERTLYEQSC